jgi:hypothetical protein
MNFKQATDQLFVNISASTLGNMMGIEAQTVRKMRLNLSSKHYRKPPEGWNRTAAKLAQREAKKLMGLAEKLRKG